MTPSSCAGCRGGEALGLKLCMAFQPIVDLDRDGAIFAYEALVRGPGGEGAAWVIEQIPPPALYAFDQACRVTAITEAAGLGLADTGAMLAINFLPNAVYDPATCIKATLRAAAATGFPHRSLMFEVSEQERVVDPQHLQAIFRAYHELGFTLAIDDFGTGHAGLALLADLRVDVVKLAIELIRGIDADRARRVIVRRVVQICGDLGIRVIAEGVETAAEAETLREVGVGLMQGFLFARPGFRSLPVPHLPRFSPTAAPAKG